MIDPSILSLTGLSEECSDLALRSRRRQFYASLLGIVPEEPTSDLRKLCAAWREFTGAKWVWLWVFHPGFDKTPGHWELTSVDADGAIDRFVPENLAPSNCKQTVAELATEIGHPILVPDISTWEKTSPSGEIHNVVCKADLHEMGCQSLLCVPINQAPDSRAVTTTATSKFGLPLKAAVCMHFDAPPPAVLEGLISLGLMGQLSARILANVYQAEHQRIIGEMNSMAVEFLTRKSNRRPADDRREYLGKVVDLICRRLKVHYVSVFCRNRSRKLVSCIATNSLHDSTGKDLTQNPKLSDIAYYKRNEGLTGKVFSRGKPYFHRIGEKPSRPQYTFRETPVEVDEAKLSWVIYPIFTQPLSDGTERREVLGVIRCVGSQASFVAGKKRNIDPLQIQTLDFIARMLSPVLEAMASNIERERVISMVKHELYSPLNMAADLVSLNLGRISERKGLGEYFFENLEFCIGTAKMLTSGLDQSPTEVREVSQAPVKMEADIVAATKSMLIPFARWENEMKVEFGDIKGVFPEYMNLDRDMIFRALCNLIVNAVKYGASGTTIRILAREDDSGYQLLVQNQGEPILEHERARIFEEGYRSESEAVQKKLGMGMGLPIAKAIMEKHGGTLRLAPAMEATVFIMSFPKHLKVD